MVNFCFRLFCNALNWGDDGKAGEIEDFVLLPKTEYEMERALAPVEGKIAGRLLSDMRKTSLALKSKSGGYAIRGRRSHRTLTNSRHVFDKDDDDGNIIKSVIYTVILNEVSKYWAFDRGTRGRCHT
ncbi:hypothetical protein RUM43_012338 [Polyplax serrata]|uniref:Uncharacterized protein n=1 Tax=Polyplax serrata TaxID=468196 RepID=A0AAN8NS34_POLSC